MAEWMKQQALTRREEDILRQVMLGLSNKGIARKLTVAVGTVKTHVKAILRKLDATSRTGAVAVAQRRGILREECECLTLDVALDRQPGSPRGATSGDYARRMFERSIDTTSRSRLTLSSQHGARIHAAR
jgi:DNA-binding CsgD family transcriptional regulator